MKGLSLIIFSWFVVIAFAQNPSTLKVGDPAPLLAPYEWIKGPAVKSWEKGRIYMVEFGSTWCTPCAAAIPHMTSIAEKYRDNVTVISLFVMERNSAKEGEPPSYVESVKRYVTKREKEIGYPVAVDSPDEQLQNTWLRPTGLIGIPHIFLVDGRGIIIWIGSNPVAAENVLISVLQAKQTLPMGEMAESFRRIQRTPPPATDEDTIAYSLLARSNETSPALYSSPYVESPYHPAGKPGEGRVRASTVTLSQLYNIAYSDTLWNQFRGRKMSTLKFPDTLENPFVRTPYGRHWYKPLIETQDAVPFDTKYNYSLILKDAGINAQRLKQIMQRDLAEHFRYDASVEFREMPCWRLVVKDRKLIRGLRAKEKEGSFDVVENDDGSYSLNNATSRDIIWMLATNYGYLDFDYGLMPKETQFPFFDETGIDFLIDFRFRKDYTFDQFKRYLNSMGLDVVRGNRRMKVIVIRDR